LGAQAASNVNWKQVGARALTYVKSAAPGVAAKASTYMSNATGGRKTIEQMAESKSPVTQTAVLKALFESGMSAFAFAEDAALTPGELAQYSGLIAQYRTAQYSSVDANQSAKPTTNDPYLDRVAINLDIKRICGLLGLSSDDYHLVVRGVNSHTSKDVELFQLDRVARGERFL
jgi:hypothetical protein